MVRHLAGMLVIASVILLLWQPGVLLPVEAAPLPFDDYWYSFRAGDDNNAVKEISHVSGPVSVKYWGKMLGELNEWGTNSKSAMLVIAESLYFASDDQLFRLDKEGNVTGQVKLRGHVGYTARPAFSGGYIILPLDGGGLEAVDPRSMESIWLADGPGDWSTDEGVYPLQNSSSLYIYNGLCYSLTLAADQNWMSVGGFVQAVDTSTGESVWLYADKPQNGGLAGFNMTGSVIMDHWLLTAGEKGDLMVFDAQTGDLLCSENFGSKINSDLVRQGYRVYFSTYDGRLISCEFDPATQTVSKRSDTAFALKSNSTPAIHGSKLYIGGLAEYGDWETGTPATGVLAVFDMGTLELTERHEAEGEVQSSPLVITGKGGEAFVYFTTNTETGYLHVLADGDIKQVFEPGGGEAQYTMFSPVADQNGTVYYALDSGYVFAIAESVPPPSAADSGPVPGPVLAIAAGAVLLAVILFFVFKLRKGKKSP